MSIEIKVPELPESIADAVIANWYKQVGESIGVDEVLVDLETDKVILEVPVVKPGVVKQILFSVGDTVTAGQLLAVIDESAQADSSRTSQAVVKTNMAENNKPAAKKSGGAMSPSVRKLVALNAIDETRLQGTGKNGRILKQDVEKYLAQSTVTESNIFFIIIILIV